MGHNSFGVLRGSMWRGIFMIRVRGWCPGNLGPLSPGVPLSSLNRIPADTFDIHARTHVCPTCLLPCVTSLACGARLCTQLSYLFVWSCGRVVTVT